MKKTLKRILSCMITLGLIIFFLYEMSSVFQPNDIIDCQYRTAFFYSLPKDSVEVMIYGSSHAFRGVKPKVFYDNYGIGAFNFAWNWQKINTTRLFIEDSLEYQKPKVALIEAFNVGIVRQNSDPGAEIFTSKYLRNEKAKREYIKNSFGTNYKSYVAYYFPVLILHENWSSLKKENFGFIEIGEGYKKAMGFSHDENVYTIRLYDSSQFEQLELSDLAISELDKIVALCKKNNIEIVFFTNPYRGEYNYRDAMTKYAQENGCYYLDFFELYDEVGFDGKKDFSDPGHLNVYGAEKVSDYLGAYLKENFELTDFREIENNIWEQNIYGDSEN